MILTKEQIEKRRRYWITTPSITRQDGVPNEGDYLDTIEAAWVEIERLRADLLAWHNGGVTEEMLRHGDGYIKVGRGCLIVSEHYLEEKDATITVLKAARDILNRQLAEALYRLGYRGYP